MWITHSNTAAAPRTAKDPAGQGALPQRESGVWPRGKFWYCNCEILHSDAFSGIRKWLELEFDNERTDFNLYQHIIEKNPWNFWCNSEKSEEVTLYGLLHGSKSPRRHEPQYLKGCDAKMHFDQLITQSGELKRCHSEWIVIRSPS